MDREVVQFLPQHLERARTMKKILLVEDNELNRDSLTRILTRKGYEVIIAVDGEEGVAKALSEAPDLILMDIGLPKLDGLGAIAQIRAAGETTPIICVTGIKNLRDLPIIALTAHALQDDQDLAINAGASDYETKPIDTARLLSKIEKHLAAN